MTDRGALLRHPLSIAGALVATVSGVVFIAMVIAVVAGLFPNPYAGLVVFIAIPACFALGLLLIPLGLRRQRQRERESGASTDWPVLDFRRASVRRTTLMIAALTSVNLVILLVAGYGSLHWMETPGFCGQACHGPMHPQFFAWQQASHARVACVECHIGEGAAGFLHAKLAGVRQLVHVATNSYPTPIPPGVDMPVGGQAPNCVRCHQPGRASGDHIRVIREYGDDEANSETLTVLQMHLGASTSSTHAIHWHADPAVKVEYVATDEERQTITFVRRTDAKGRVQEFRTAGAAGETAASGELRPMDCVDCHNVIGHPISPTPEKAVDRAIAAALISRDLPFVRREGVRLLKESYPDQDAGLRAIEQGLRKFYESQEGNPDPQAVARSVAALQDLYRHNVFPAMNVSWGAYRSNSGHVTSNGCFRCHDDEHKASDGSAISADCEYCHTQIERPQGQP